MRSRWLLPPVCLLLAGCAGIAEPDQHQRLPAACFAGQQEVLRTLGEQLLDLRTEYLAEDGHTWAATPPPIRPGSTEARCRVRIGPPVDSGDEVPGGRPGQPRNRQVTISYALLTSAAAADRVREQLAAAPEGKPARIDGVDQEAWHWPPRWDEEGGPAGGAALVRDRGLVVSITVTGENLHQSGWAPVETEQAVVEAAAVARTVR